MWTSSCITDQLPAAIYLNHDNGYSQEYRLRLVGGGAFRYIYQYYFRSPATDMEDIAFQSYSNDEQTAINVMRDKLRAVGISC